jgi:hypothetical protein
MAHHPVSKQGQSFMFQAFTQHLRRRQVELAPAGWRLYVQAFIDAAPFNVGEAVYCAHCESELHADGTGHDITCDTVCARMMLADFDTARQVRQFVGSVMLPILEGTEGMHGTQHLRRRQVELAPAGWRLYVQAFIDAAPFKVGEAMYCAHCDSELKDDGSGHDVTCDTVAARMELADFDLDQQFVAAVMLPILKGTEGMHGHEFDAEDRPGAADGIAGPD